MSHSRMIRAPRPNATPEQAGNARARAWAYVFSCYEAKKQAGVVRTNAGENEERGLNESLPAIWSLPRQV